MRLTIWLTVIPLIGLASGAWPSQLKGDEETDIRRSALQPVSFRPLALGQVKLSGWLREQLKTQAAGLSVHLDEFWPEIKNSAWIGGNAEGWERVPYWLDGIVPLVYLLDDQALQAGIKPFIDSIIEHQHPDGWLGPVGDTAGHKPYDPWPLFPLFKALTQYQEATGDPRVVPALLRCARKIDQVIDQKALFSWAKMRVADFAVSLYWLYDRTAEAWLLDLARKAFAQSHDWRAQFDDFKFTGKTQNRFDLDTHGVNTDMALKYGRIRYLHTGDARRGDQLEKLAFNALPATFKKDMTAPQFDQQCNQVICSKEGEHVYLNIGPDSNLYGLEPNFGCCTANLHQGWPKLTSSLWMRSADGGLAAIAYAPCIVETQIQGKLVRVEITTDYPFRDTIEIAVTVPQAMSFSLYLRVPAWTKDPTIRADSVKTAIGKPGRYFYIQGTWSGTKTISLRLPMSVCLYHGFNDSVAIERGPLVYALKIGAEWRKVKDNPQFADWEVFPTTPWNYALEIDREHPERSVTFDQEPMGTSPFTSEAAPVIARVKGRRLADWKIAKGAAAPPPSSPVKSAAPLEKLILIPYGCTDLRITEFPTLAPH